MAKPKVCLAYSGGLDTSEYRQIHLYCLLLLLIANSRRAGVILKWLIEQGYDVVAFMVAQPLTPPVYMFDKLNVTL